MDAPHLPQTFRYHARARTRWSDEDNQAVVNNAVYLTLLEEARHGYFGALGLLAANRFPFLLAQTNIRFLRPGRGGVELDVAVATTHLGRTSFVQAYRVSPLDAAGAPDFERAWCEAEALLVVVDRDARPAPMADGFRAAVAGLEGLPAATPGP
jgi:YbgC/YbaW family acyl-CoA thioester hydrolase